MSEQTASSQNNGKDWFLKPFWPFIKRRRWLFIISFLTLLCTNLLTLITPILIGESTDLIKAIGEGTSRDFIWLVTMVLWLFAAEATLWTARYFWRRYNYTLGPFAEYDLRRSLLEHLQTLSPSFYVRNRTGEIMSRASADVGQVANFFMSGSIIFFDSFLYIVTVPFVLFYLNWQLTLIFLAPLPILILITRRFTRKIFKQSHRVQQQDAELNAKVHENIAGARVIKAFNQEENEMMTFNELNDRLIEKSYLLQLLSAMFHPLLMICAEALMLIVWVVGGMDVISGKMTIGEFFSYNLFLGRLTWPMVGTGYTITLYQIGKVSMERINKILNEPAEIVDDPAAVADMQITGEIEFRNLNFRYTENGVEILKDFNLKVEAGKTVALVGPVGCGKTTTINLVPRLFEPPDASVFIDGVDIKKIPMETLRAAIGYAPQEPFLFSDTIAENVALGSIGNPGMDEVQHAAEIAALNNDVDQFPDKYDQMVGERGVTLSGGQKQRATIARVAIRTPKILLLDDCLASVDAKTEEIILKNLRKLRGNRTCLMASHRISTIKDADMIVVIDNGTIVEQGKHDELLKLNGLYAELHRKQILREQLGMK